MTRETGETYRNYFNRLVGFTRQHLPQRQITVEGVTVPAAGKTLTVALLDSIAVHWLLNINRRLVNIIKIEFAAEPKTKRLSEMIKTITSNFDELLARYDSKGDQIDVVKSGQVSKQTPTNATNNDNDSSSIDMIIRRIEKLERNKNKSSSRRQSFRRSNFKQMGCRHCLFINKQLNANLDTNHDSSMCSKRKLSVNLLETYEEEVDPHIATSSNSDDTGDLEPSISKFSQNPFLQTELTNTSELAAEFYPDTANSNLLLSSHHNNSRQITASDVSDVKSPLLAPSPSSKPDSVQIVPVLSSSHNQAGSFVTSHGFDHNNFAALLRRVQSSSYEWNSVHKATSPKIKCKYNEVVFPSLLDSGAEINVLDQDFVNKVGICVSNTSEKAHAANKLPLEITGQTMEPVTIQC